MRDILSRPETDWTRWITTFLASAAVLGATLFGFVAMLDPFGLRVGAGGRARPIMDINQRYMYPQLVRSQAFDSAVFGTSTMRLLDPATLSQSIGGRFSNLAMNAATPWEQVQMLQLFARETPSPRAVIWGIDSLWCNADATDADRRLTPRPFPPWLYDDPAWTDAARQLNLTTLEIAARLLGHHLGMMPARIRGDGYEVFTPPEESYDLARARMHIKARQAVGDADPAPPATVDPQERANWRFPALAWLNEALGRLPRDTRILIVLPPLHASLLPVEGTAEGQRFQGCKDEIAAIAGRHGAAMADYANASALTRTDENYWDPMHYRLPIARRIESDLAAVMSGGAPVSGDDILHVTPAPR